MGTRADFYVGNGTKAEWLGSVGHDGYQWAEDKNSPIRKAKTEQEFRDAVLETLKSRRDDATLPQEGWPWPWKDSRTTDYVYWFKGKACWSHWSKLKWPDMTKCQNVKFGGPQSGLIIVRVGDNRVAQD